MTDTKRIKEAIEFYENWKEPESRSSEDVIRHTETLLSLARDYLNRRGI